MAKKTYTLTRTSPNGTTFTWSTTFPTKRKAVSVAAQDVADNTGCMRREANAYGARLEDAELGTDVQATASGVAYRIDAA